MRLNKKTVFILGAGFTKAFVPNAPLLEDEYNGDILKEKFKSFPHASRVLKNELNRKPRGKINLERLMTRLHGQMPYDQEQGACDELNLLLSELKQVFSERLNDAKSKQFYKDEISSFARLCIDNNITCITFNYDDILDEALWSIVRAISKPNVPHWHPDGGYGFFCKPSLESIRETLGLEMDITSMLLLKLHGSVNWRVRRGYPQPYSIDAIVHHTGWLKYAGSVDLKTVEMHLEKEPFIVPPLLTKEALINQPILRLIWSHAYNTLRQADQVVFVGYSFPVTDIASSFLFAETISPECMIRVVNYAKTKNSEAEIRRRYRKIFPKIRYEYFEFDGALNWTNKLVQQNRTVKKTEKEKNYIPSEKEISKEQRKVLAHLYFDQAQSIEKLSKNTKLPKEQVIRIIDELSGLVYDKNSNGQYWAKVVNPQKARRLALEASRDRKDEFK